MQPPKTFASVRTEVGKILLGLVCVFGYAAGAAPIAAQDVNAKYLPFPQSKLRRFPLRRVALPNNLPSGRPFTVAGVIVRELTEETAANSDDAREFARPLVFSGRDRAGQAWELKTEGWIHYDAVYIGDLDRNGVRDLVFSIGTGANGLGEPTHLIFLTFNREGRPTLFEATGFFAPRRTDIFDLADLDGDGRAELLYMVFDDGYWITNIYRIRDGEWSRVEGRFAGLSFPAYTRFTNRPNHRPVRPAPGRNPQAPDLIEQNRQRREDAGRQRD
jgi:hypothetical protein